jgi:putative membrane protein
MVKQLIRFFTYFAVFGILALIGAGVYGDIGGLLLMALILTLANLIVRPILTVLALPFNILTFGIASLFVNMLTLLIADAIVSSAFVAGFWWMLLASALIMVGDAIVRSAYHERYRNGIR